MTSKHSDLGPRDRRRAAVDSVRGSLAAEGLEPTADYEVDAEQYVSGSLTADELVARAEQRHRKTSEPGTE